MSLKDKLLSSYIAFEDHLDDDSPIHDIRNNAIKVFDVRKKGEFKSEHVLDAESTPLSELNKHLAEYPEKEDFLVHCAGGYRSVIASSILKSRGIHNLIDVKGGFGALKHEGVRTTDYVCPTTL